MKKTLLIGWKDVVLAFRDRAALILMLAAPFVLTLGLGFVSGAFSGRTSGPSDIAVVLVNQDEGALGANLVALMRSAGLDDLLEATVLDDAAQARAQVDGDQAAAAVLIPAGLTRSVVPEGVTAQGEPAQITLYANPTRPTSAGIVQTIVDAFVSQVEVGRVAGEVTVRQLLEKRLIQPQDTARAGAEVGSRLAAASRATSPIAVDGVTAGGEAVEFNALAYMAPGMALMFLMFTVVNGGRSLLLERGQGTLPRLLVSPTSTGQVLAGKLFGTYLTGVAQVLILILASALLFSLRWGHPVGVVTLTLAAVAGAVGWGMLITALCKTPGQVSAVGAAVMLTFGILGGSFFSMDYMPRWFAALSRITPNAWGLNGFTALARGDPLSSIWATVAALVIMGAALFALSAVLLARRGIGRA